MHGKLPVVGEDPHRSMHGIFMGEETHIPKLLDKTKAGLSLRLVFPKMSLNIATF